MCIKTLTVCIDIVVRVIDFVLALLLNFNVHGERGERDQIGISLFSMTRTTQRLGFRCGLEAF